LTPSSGSWTVSPEASPARLDQFLAGMMPAQSRSQLQNWIRAGRVRVNGKATKTGYLVRPGDRITVEHDTADIQTGLPQAEDIPLKVVYEDEELAVIEKPAGMVCHVGAGVRSGTLVNALLHYLGAIETGDPARPGVVHRLDKPASGLLVVAKNTAAHRVLARQFKDRQVKKEYLALVYGIPKAREGTVDKPLGRDPSDRKKMSVRARHARQAITHYTLVEQLGSMALLRIRIETGRTHQIRAHLASIGHAIVGDEIYGGNRIRNLPKAQQAVVQQLDRLFLHACRLGFRHPRSGAPMEFPSELPLPLQDLLTAVRLDGVSRKPL
jgi:23S rRNA pseudouridine1911/1915/1917 synthase